MNESLNEILKTVLSLSLSGSLLIAALFLCRRLVKDRFSKRWQYYIWLTAIARLILPFTPQESLTGTLLQAVQESCAAPVCGTASLQDTLPSSILESAPAVPDIQKNAPAADAVPDILESASAAAAMPNILTAAVSYLWLAWLGVALLLLIRKITVYQSFVNYIKAGWEEVSDTGQLDKLAQTAAQTGVKRPVELYTNRLVSSPLLLGFFYPCIVLPSAGLPDTDFQYTVQHELIHYKRHDAFYKWLVQAVICIHWFNPLVHLMGKELNRACELACDEAVIQKLDIQGRRSYGDTLLHAIGAGGVYKDSITSVTLCESAELLKERLKAIMDFKQKSKLVTALSALLTAVLMTGAVSVGAYTGSAAQDTSSPQSPKNSQELSISAKQPAADSQTPSASAKQSAADSQTPSASDKQSAAKSQTPSALAGQCYKAGNIALFQAVFPQMNESEQKSWLNKIYSNGKTAFFAAAIGTLDEDSALVSSFAKKTYADGAIAFFSILAGRMSDKELKSWLARALEDKNTSFASVIFNTAGMNAEREALEQELEKQRLAEYESYGITKKGKAYYYKGRLVNILLDTQSAASYVTLEINPKGTVNVKITRGRDGKIKRVSYMTQEEADALLEDNTKK